MARDYKSRAQRKKQKQPVSVWAWLVTGYIAGVLSIGTVWWKFGAGPDQAEAWIGDKPPTGSAGQPAPLIEDAEESQVEPPQFDFYSLLPQMEVVVPDDELESELAAAPPPSKPEPGEPETPIEPQRGYLIQVGSFKNAGDAERVKAQLALLGLQAKTNRVSSKGVVWHRVRVGPFHTSEAVKQARNRLTGNGYKTLVIRHKP